MRFNPATYTVTEGVDATAVITLETIGAHPHIINVTVIAKDGSAARGYIICNMLQSYKFQYDSFPLYNYSLYLYM